MKTFQRISSKLIDWDQAANLVASWKGDGLKTVFTNGCFDLIHYGHIHYLSAAKDLGDRLIIGMNTDRSVRRLKGNSRPVKEEQTRAHLLAALAFVDAVVLFEDDTPYDLIKKLEPDVLVKGGDWSPDQIVGADIVQKAGGEVKSLSFQEGWSSTRYIEKIKQEQAS